MKNKDKQPQSSRALGTRLHAANIDEGNSYLIGPNRSDPNISKKEVATSDSESDALNRPSINKSSSNHESKNDSNLKEPSVRSSTLAPVQRQTLDFLRNFMADRGYAPSLKEISEHIGVKSLSTAHFHLERLTDKGFIKRGADGSLELVEVQKPDLGPTAVPLVGVIAAGLPIEAIENSTMIDIPPAMLTSRGEVFCLEVSGNSMIEDHICDGDIIVVQRQSSADDGQIVVALLEDGTATLKRYRRLKNGKVMLIPANSTMAPITVDKVEIQGRLVGVIRQLH